MMTKVPAIGIDLGTSYCSVGVFQNGKVEVIANSQGKRATSSYVAFTDAGCLIGDAAKNRAVMNPENVIFDSKRLIGRKFEDQPVLSDMEHWPFEVIQVGGKLKLLVEHDGEFRSFFPEEITSMVLTRMKENAEAYIGKTVTNAVITVPAYFTDAQRQATKESGTLAGLNVLRVINEPTAAALAYGLHRRDKENKNIMVIDLGGGTFDVSILTIKDSNLDVRSTAGDTNLGGVDFDTRMVAHFVQEFKRKYKKDITSSKIALQRLRLACERAKRTLSSSTQAVIEIPFLFEGISFKKNISRAYFEILCLDLFLRGLDLIDKSLRDANMDKSQIQDIVVIGGSTRIPKIQEMLRVFFNGKELNMSFDSYEAVTCGAAVQAAILNGEMVDVRISELTPYCYGVGVADGGLVPIIKKGTSIPIKQTEIFATFCNNQSEALILVYEGERAITKGNNLIGRIEVSDIPPAPRGIFQMQVTFDIDANGILNVRASENPPKIKTVKLQRWWHTSGLLLLLLATLLVFILPPALGVCSGLLSCRTCTEAKCTFCSSPWNQACVDNFIKCPNKTTLVFEPRTNWLCPANLPKPPSAIPRPYNFSTNNEDSSDTPKVSTGNKTMVTTTSASSYWVAGAGLVVAFGVTLQIIGFVFSRKAEKRNSKLQSRPLIPSTDEEIDIEDGVDHEEDELPIVEERANVANLDALNAAIREGRVDARLRPHTRYNAHNQRLWDDFSGREEALALILQQEKEETGESSDEDGGNSGEFATPALSINGFLSKE